MRKATLMRVDALYKQIAGRTDVIMSPDGYCNSDGIGSFKFTVDDALCPELGQRLLVAVEAIPADAAIKETEDKNIYIQKYKDRQDGAIAVANGRKFR